MTGSPCLHSARQLTDYHLVFFFVQELRQNDIIDRLKVFALNPDPGTAIEVSAGEEQPLKITYSADSLSYGGVHDLPVLVRPFWVLFVQRVFSRVQMN